MQPLVPRTVTHLELEVLAWCSDERAATQPQHDQDGQEETAEQDPPRQPGAPIPRTGIAQLPEPHTFVPSTAQHSPAQ